MYNTPCSAPSRWPLVDWPRQSCSDIKSRSKKQKGNADLPSCPVPRSICFVDNDEFLQLLERSETRKQLTFSINKFSTRTTD